ncbi:MAG: hypothetical protein XD50_0679 [Clostridia bacterium 41_269]|nr:MAG: hypothetical protein XD50_0679 [Clostridia bacterium 41_269]
MTFKVLFIQEEKGFTLLELAISIVFMVFLISCLVPFSLKAVSKNELKNAAHTIATDIRNGQQMALAQEYAFFKIKFMPHSNSYRIYFNREDPMKYEIKKLPKRVILVGTNFDNHTVHFNARGTVIKGGTITLEDIYKKRMYVKVQPVTGRVKVDAN